MAVCEVWIVVDENGDCKACDERDVAEERYRDDIGTDAGVCMRVIRLTVTIPEPKPMEVSCNVPEGAEGEVTVTVS